MSEQQPSAQHSLGDLRQLKWLLGQVLALLSLGTLFQVEFVATAQVVTAGLAIVATLVFPRLPQVIAGRIYWLLTIALVAFVAADFIRLGGSDLLPPMLRLILWLTVLRCLQYRSRREDLQLVLLTMFICIMSGVMTLSLEFGVQLLIYTPVAMFLLFLINLLEPLPEQVLTGDEWRHFRWGSFCGRVVRRVDFKMVGLATMLFATVVLVSSIIFIALPRFNLDQNLAFLQMPGAAGVGFSDTVRIGDVRSIIEGASRDQVALRVEPPEGMKLPPNPYWRMVVLDRYNDGRFSLSHSVQGRNSPPDNEFRRYRGGGRGDGANWNFFLEGNISRYLPLPGDFDTVRLERRGKGTINESILLLQLQQTPSSVFGYRVEDPTNGRYIPASPEERQAFDRSAAVTGGSGDRADNDYPQTQQALSLAAEDRALLASIVEEVVAGRELSNTDLAMETTRWLQGRYSYSLSEDSSTRYRDRDPVCRWLATASRGWCEHFAGALVLLLRTAGVPARMVVGFNGAIANDYRGYYTVPNRFAHAWVEVYDGEREWVRFDPTPPREIDSFTGEGLMPEMSGWKYVFGSWLDSLRMAWYGNVIAFGQDEQEELAESLRDRTTDFFARLNARLDRSFHDFVQWLRSPWNIGRIVRVALPALTAVAFLVVLIVFRGWIAVAFYRMLRGFGVMRRSDPARRRARHHLRRFHRAVAASPDNLPDGWHKCQRQLELICFGREEDRPPLRPVFACARQLLAAARRGSKPNRTSVSRLTPGTISRADQNGRT